MVARHHDRFFDFFGVPREFRDLVFDAYWEDQNSIAAYHRPVKMGVLAYYDGHRRDESHVDHYRRLKRTKRP